MECSYFRFLADQVHYYLTSYRYAKAKKEKFADKLAEVNFKNYYQGFFNEYKSQVLSLKSQILRSENELNSLVFALYDLSADEIALIENS